MMDAELMTDAEPGPAPAAAHPGAAAVEPTPVVPTGSGFRPEVQALRAAAVLLVVGFHLWPDQVRGGFAGVDVFFVISGFLISGHLARELASDGRIRLPAFYARRARRLLPAALTVLLASAVGVFVVLPVTAWKQSFHEILAAALYYENWSLAGSSVDYFGAENVPTVVQHFWSLSVEEQFYLGWPVLFLLAAAGSRWIPLGRGDRTARRRRMLGVVCALALVASFVWSAWLDTSGGAAYFSTFTRAWEFAAGGLLALIGTVRSGGRRAAVLSWVGWSVVLGSGVLLTSAWRFPGWTAVFPVLGTVAVIAAGSTSSRFGLARLVRSRVVQFTGGISYSLYLWHWPVIILFGREPGAAADNGVNRFVLLGFSVLLAVLSTYLIEVPLRRRSGWSSVRADGITNDGTTNDGTQPGRRRIRIGGTARTLLLAATGMAVVGLVAGVGLDRAHEQQVAAERQVAAFRANPPDCFGAAALDPARPSCRSAAAVARTGALLIPNPVAAQVDLPDTCMQAIDRTRVRVCTVGRSAATATREVALIGDSHAMAWLPAVETVAQERGWRLVVLLKGSCPLTNALRDSSPSDADSCRGWNEGVQDYLTRHPDIDQVIVSASSKNQFVPDPGLSWNETATRGYVAAWAALPRTIKRILVLRDVPRPLDQVVACSESALNRSRSVRECGLPTAQAVLDDPEADAVRRSDRSPVLLDLTRYFCADGFCSPGVGGVFVYRDAHHITATFARTLAPYLATMVPADPVAPSTPAAASRRRDEP